jgi:hypothetical protein
MTITKPECLQIAEDEGTAAHYGGDQEWYGEEWRRMAGCGPTSAANVTAYLALTRPALRGLYAGEDMRRSLFTAHMEELYRYVTPGNMGLNRPEMFTQGVEAFAASRGLTLVPHLFEVHGYLHGGRPPVQALAAFVRQGLESDCPVAFLNLTKGRVKNIQGWHWTTLVGADMEDGRLSAIASDEGKQIRFDLRLWYLSTRMRGGLVYFTES